MAPAAAVEDSTVEVVEVVITEEAADTEAVVVDTVVAVRVVVSFLFLQPLYPLINHILT